MGDVLELELYGRAHSLWTLFSARTIGPGAMTLVPLPVVVAWGSSMRRAAISRT